MGLGDDRGDGRARGRRRSRWGRRASDCASDIECCDGCGGDGPCSVALLAAVLLLGALRPVGRSEYARRPGWRRWPSRRIRSYQMHVSGKPGVGRCNLQPTCSAYGLAAFDAHGPWRATAMVRARLRRCRAEGQRRRNG